MDEGRVVRVAAPLVIAEGLRDAAIADTVRVGPRRLVGEILEIRQGRVCIQMLEDATGLCRGDGVALIKSALAAELGPGLLGTVFDGLQRPFAALRQRKGAAEVPALDRARRWHFTPLVAYGSAVKAGDAYGYVWETPAFCHKIMVPPGGDGVITDIREGEFCVTDCIGRIKRLDSGRIESITLMQRWPLREPRPIAERSAPSRPLATGVGVIDDFFPLAEGGTACLCGPFGYGAEALQRRLACVVEADVVIYVGCGVSGNGTAALWEALSAQTAGEKGSLAARTVRIDCPTDGSSAAREIAVYTGMTIAEYFRDMGLSAVMIADDLNRMAEGLREVALRLEIPVGEEGYPVSLARRLSELYERAGCAVCLGGEEREGALSLIGVVSPRGGELCEPVTQAALACAGVLWRADVDAACGRRYPAMDESCSYSRYRERSAAIPDGVWEENRERLLTLLRHGRALRTRLGAYSEEEKLTVTLSRIIREAFLRLHTLANESDGNKSHALAALILSFEEQARGALARGARTEDITALSVWERMEHARYATETYEAEYADIAAAATEELAALAAETVGGAV